MANLNLVQIFNGSKFIRTAQMPPPPPPPPAPGGMPPPPAPGGPPAMPGAPPAPGAPGTAPMADEAQVQHIAGPLDGLIKVLFDADITQYVESNANKSPEDIAMKIWTDYGGKPDGNVDDSHKGTRSDDASAEDPNSEQAKQEYQQTEKQKWLRLPQDETIGDITTLDELTNAIQGLIGSVTKNMAKQNSAPPGGGGMPPGLASKKLVQVRLAFLLNEVGAYCQADSLLK